MYHITQNILNHLLTIEKLKLLPVCMCIWLLMQIRSACFFMVVKVAGVLGFSKPVFFWGSKCPSQDQ